MKEKWEIEESESESVVTWSISLNGSHEIGVPEIPVILPELHFFEVLLIRHRNELIFFVSGEFRAPRRTLDPRI